MVECLSFTDPSEVLSNAGQFLCGNPIEHNVILSLLHRRCEDEVPGRYWVAHDHGKVVGVVFQSPVDSPVSLTPMTGVACRSVVTSIAHEGIWIPGVIGDAATASHFAGHWTEVTRSSAEPSEGQRIYALGELDLSSLAEGELTMATFGDLDLVVEWMERFSREAGTPRIPESVVLNRLRNGEFWLWCNAGPVCVAAHTEEVAGAARIYGVYTPKEHRQMGYARACVGRLSELLIDRGISCTLYTDLSNPVSNAVYRRLGYEAIGEVIRYEFAHSGEPAMEYKGARPHDVDAESTYRCDACGFEHDPQQASVLGQAIVDGVDTLVSLLRMNLDAVSSRPEPGTWSPLEYGCHVRDVLLVQRERILAAQFIDVPSFNAMGGDERVTCDGYAGQDIQNVLRQLRDSAFLLANVLQLLGEDQWNLPLIYGYPVPTQRSLRWLAVHTLHEVRHHTLDVSCQLS